MFGILPDGSIKRQNLVWVGEGAPGEQGDQHLFLLRGRVPIRFEGKEWTGDRGELKPERSGQWDGIVREGALRVRLYPPSRPPDQTQGAPIPPGGRSAEKWRAWELGGGGVGDSAQPYGQQAAGSAGYPWSR